MRFLHTSLTKFRFCTLSPLHFQLCQALCGSGRAADRWTFLIKQMCVVWLSLLLLHGLLVLHSKLHSLFISLAIPSTRLIVIAGTLSTISRWVLPIKPFLWIWVDKLNISKTIKLWLIFAEVCAFGQFASNLVELFARVNGNSIYFVSRIVAAFLSRRCPRYSS